MIILIDDGMDTASIAHPLGATDHIAAYSQAGHCD